jgi:predicted DNA-binding transcriptional regulator AlpA
MNLEAPTNQAARPQRLLITATELAAMMQISIRTLWRLRSAGELLEPVRIGGNAAGQRLAANDALLVLPSSGSAVALPPEVVRIAEAWANLPAHIREAILMLVEAIENRPEFDETREEGANSALPMH